MTQQYSRAERLLTRPFPDTDDDVDFEHPPTNGHTYPSAGLTSTVPFPDNGRGKGRATDPFNSLPPFAAPHAQAHRTRLSLTGTGERLPMGPSTAGGDIGIEQPVPMSMLVDMSVACRYLAAQCQVRQGKWAEATEMLGEANPFRGTCELLGSSRLV
jgi:anaphase-promoting complex subunit 6